MSQDTLFGTDDDSGPDRRYECTDCGGTVRARWFGAGSFAIGCRCTTVPVVPQMRQADTPESWRVERPACCRGVEPTEMEPVYGERGRDFRCPECGAEYSYDGEMQRAREVDRE